ncbi:MAG TPA: NADH-quinone oxidoreductase subunit NuoE [Acidobacteriota bacterium]|nr:NADH-quinone oxidoreductase subunit NuoE [Acidobacteriota bacterium]
MSEASETFEFTSQNLERCQDYLKRYPTKQAAMLPVLHVAQEQHGFISKEVETAVAEVLEVPEVEVHKVVTFYTLFHRHPVGRHQIRLCMNLACWLRGSDCIKAHLEEKLGVASGGTTSDGKITWEAVSDCMGACEDAPMMQLDKDYYDELTPEKVDQILEKETA